MTVVPVEELERVVSVLHALAVAARSNDQQLSPWWAAAALEDVDRFVGVCAEHGLAIRVDRGRLDEVMTRYHGGDA